MLIVRLGIILMFIASIASGGLALLNQKTAPIIAENKAKKRAEARIEVMESVNGKVFEEYALEDGNPYWIALDGNGSRVGFVGIAYGPAYSSTIETVCGFNNDYEVTGLKIIFQQETPGLGTKAVEVKKGENKPWFQRQFEGMDAFTLAVDKDRGEIDSITGATITARAIANSVKKTAEMIKVVAVEIEETDEPVEEEQVTEEIASGDAEEVTQ